MGDFKNPYALRDGKIVYIEDLSPSERGLACNCVCPCCGEIMVAKMGDVNEHHFAHHGSSNCSGGYETALHLLAKQLIAEKIPLLLPPSYSSFNDIRGTLIQEDGTLFQAVRGIGSTSIVPDEVKMEESLNSIRPDLLVFKKGKPLIVEILVSHAVDEHKLEEIKEMGISAIEIDLSEYKSTFLTREELAKILSTRHDNKKWLNNEKMKAYDSKIQNNIDKLFRVEESKTEIRMETNVLTNNFKHTVSHDCIYDCPKKPQFDGKYCYAHTRNCLACDSFYCLLQKVDTKDNRFVLCASAGTTNNIPSQKQILEYIHAATNWISVKDDDSDEDIKHNLEEKLSGLAPEYKKMVNYEAIINKKIPEIRKLEEKKIYSELYRTLSFYTDDLVMVDLYRTSFEKEKNEFLTSYPEFQKLPASNFYCAFKKFFDEKWKIHILTVQKYRPKETNYMIKIVLEKIPRSNYKNFEEWFQTCVSYLAKIRGFLLQCYDHTISIVPYFQEYLEKRHIN